MSFVLGKATPKGQIAIDDCIRDARGDVVALGIAKVRGDIA